MNPLVFYIPINSHSCSLPNWVFFFLFSSLLKISHNHNLLHQKNMSVSKTEAEQLNPEEETSTANSYHYQYYNNPSSSSGVSEIEEENSSDLFEVNHGVPMASIKEKKEGSLFSFDVHNGEDSVYVGVGKSESSLDALSWTLKNAVNESTMVYLIHVFPETHHIPSPCKVFYPFRFSCLYVDFFS